MAQRKTKAGGRTVERPAWLGPAPPTYGEVFARIGTTEAENVTWLFHFAAASIKGLDHAKQIALMENVHTFCLLSGSASPDVWRTQPVRDFALWAEHSPSLVRKRWHEIESLQIVTRDALLGCAERQYLRLPKLRMELEMDFSQWTPADSRPSFPQFWFFPPVRPDDSFEGAFIYRLACLLFIEGHRIGQCPSAACNQPLRLFLRTKSDQLFCSNTCRSREAMKKWRKKKANAKTRTNARTMKKGGSHAKR